MIRAYLLLMLGLGWGAPQQPLFRIHCSTRHVTCLTEEVIGTSGGLRRVGTGPVEMPGLVVRGICGQTIASEAGLYQDGRCLDPRPAWSVAQTPGGLASGHRQGRVKFWTTGSEVQCPTDAPGVARFRHQFWLASQNGIYRFDPVSGGCQQVLAELPDSWVTCLESFHGQLWTGTFRGGLCHFDGRNWSREERPGPRIHCLLATAAGLWIGTPRGLMWTDGRSWRTYDRAQGLPSNAIWSLAVRGDQLWIGTDSGLCQASLRAFTQSARGL